MFWLAGMWCWIDPCDANSHQYTVSLFWQAKERQKNLCERWSVGLMRSVRLVRPGWTQVPSWGGTAPQCPPLAPALYTGLVWVMRARLYSLWRLSYQLWLFSYVYEQILTLLIDSLNDVIIIASCWTTLQYCETHSWTRCNAILKCPFPYNAHIWGISESYYGLKCQEMDTENVTFCLVQSFGQQ